MACHLSAADIRIIVCNHQRVADMLSVGFPMFILQIVCLADQSIIINLRKAKRGRDLRRLNRRLQSGWAHILSSALAPEQEQREDAAAPRDCSYQVQFWWQVPIANRTPARCRLWG